MYVFCLLQDENPSSRRGGTTTIWDSGIGGLSSTSNMATQLEGEEDSMSVVLYSTAFIPLLPFKKVFTSLLHLTLIFNYLQILTVFVWSPTAFHTVEVIWRKECSFLSGCPSTRSTMSFCMTYWMLHLPCSPEKGSHCGLVTTSRATPM